MADEIERRSPGAPQGSPDDWQGRHGNAASPPPGAAASPPPPRFEGSSSPPPPPYPGTTGYGWPAASAPPPPPARGRAVVLLALIVALVAGGAAGALGSWLVWSRSGSTTSSGYRLSAPPSGTVSRPATSLAGIAQRVMPSVVMIKVNGQDGGGTGSGFIVDGGYIVTNNHVVADAAQGGSIEVDFNDGRKASAQIVGRDPSSDLAVIKPQNAGSLPALPFGNSDSIAVGDPVIAVGSPLGLQGTVTSGIVSAKNRAVQAGGEGGASTVYINAIQTDAAINPGNSGGPLVDMNGQVIGVNSAIASLGQQLGPGQQSGSIGVGFAIPSNQARRVIEELVRTGKATHSVIGASIDLTYQGQGARIVPSPSGGQPAIVPGGPADKAGLRPGDVIVEFDGKPINNPDELIVAIRSHQPGDKVSITYLRGGARHTTQLTLGSSS